MHELPITQAILQTALAASERNGGRRITSIQLVIGELSSIVDDSVQFYFDQLSQGTLAEQAVLEFRREPSTAFCFDCSSSFPVRAPLPAQCPHCGGTRLRVQGGREFYIESIEVQDETAGS